MNWTNEVENEMTAGEPSALGVEGGRLSVQGGRHTVESARHRAFSPRSKWAALVRILIQAGGKMDSYKLALAVRTTGLSRTVHEAREHGARIMIHWQTAPDGKKWAVHEYAGADPGSLAEKAAGWARSSLRIW